MKKYIAAVLVCFAVLALSACGKEQPPVGSSENHQPDTTVTTQGTQPSETLPPTTQPETTAPADDPQEIYDEDGRLLESISGNTRTVYTYDDRGNLLDKTEEVNGKEARRWTYGYDEKNRVLLEAYSEKGVEQTRTTYAFDGSGKLTEKAYYTKGKEQWRETYHPDGGYTKDSHPQEHEDCREIFNKNGDLVELIFYCDGAESYRSIFIYNDKGQLTQDINYENGIESCRSQYFYNEKGEEIRVRMEFPLAKVESNVKTTHNRVSVVYREGKLLTETYFENGTMVRQCHYDDNGQLIKEALYQEGTVHTTHCREYDSQGNCILLITTDAAGEETCRTEYFYDEENRLTESIQGEEITRYTYDAQGNLLTQVTTVADAVIRSEEYRCTYENESLTRKEYLLNGQLNTVWYYNSNGQVLEQVSYTDGKETGSELYTYWDHHVQAWRDAGGSTGELSNITAMDSMGVVLCRSYYQNDVPLMEEYFNTKGQLVQKIYYQNGTVTRELTVYEYTYEEAETDTVTAQRVTGVHFPALDNSPFSYYYEYDGGKLIRGIFNGDDWVETVYNRSYDLPLYADWVDCYTDENCRREFTYDEQGRLTQVCYHTAEEETFRTTYAYDSAGNLAEEATYWSGELEERILYTYNAKGQLTEKLTQSDQLPTHRYTLRYDDRGNCIEERVESDDSVSVYTFRFDEKNNLLEERFTSDGEEGYQYTYHYDSKGMLQQRINHTAEGDYVETFEYDKAGRLTHVYLGDFPQTIYLYNEQGKLSEYILYSDTNTDEIAHHRYLYDEKGMLYEIVLTYGDYSPGSVLITYDTVTVSPEEAAQLEQILKDTLDGI